MDQTAFADKLRQKLKVRHLEAKENFAENHPDAKSFFDSVNLDLGKIRQHSVKLLTAGTIGGALLMSPSEARSQGLLVTQPSAYLASPGAVLSSPDTWLKESLKVMLPPKSSQKSLPVLDPKQEKVVASIIEQATGVPTVASLEGEHLNTVWGYIGQEQHLPLYPGDTIKNHPDFQNAGITDSIGAFGYFAKSGKLTEDAVLREKYYVAVQTLYLPNWNTRWKYLVDWYKWRKVIVVNPENGKVVVADIGDAGPAYWTGKQFGGSPEVMDILGGPEFRKGEVLLFFVDDPKNSVPLGEVKYTSGIGELDSLSVQKILNSYPSQVF